MKKMMYGVLAVLLMAACRTSNITTSWKAAGVPATKFSKILVLGIIREADRSIQENMENHFVGDLKELGYNAVSSLKEFGPRAFNDMTEEQAVAKLKNSGIDAVITIVLLDKQRERRYVPGRLNYSPYTYKSNKLWGYRAVMYNRIYEPGYYITDTRYFWESNLYEMNSQKLLYSVQTQSFDPANSESMGHEYGKMIVKNMVTQGLLVKQ
ncbi:MAG: hypothetical protein JST86_05635 [Bacteroidetes bacterium]|nr:hypothetical protein [Bacteroidota bacterium]